MKLAMIGLGKMGGNMATRLVQKGISVVGFDRSAEVVKTLEEKAKIIGATSVADALTKLDGQKIVWLMVPAGNPTEEQINELIPMLNKGDIIIDGGNSNYKDSQRIGKSLEEKGIGFMDCGTSGGVCHRFHPGDKPDRPRRFGLGVCDFPWSESGWSKFDFAIAGAHLLPRLFQLQQLQRSPDRNCRADHEQGDRQEYSRQRSCDIRLRFRAHLRPRSRIGT